MIPRWRMAGLFLLCQPAAALAQQAALEAGPAAAVAPDCARQNRQLQRQAACAVSDKICLVAWSDGTRTVEQPTADIYCARLDASGQTLDPAGIGVCRAADLQESPAVAFDGTNFLVVWQDLRSGTDYDIYAARISPRGKVLDPEGFAVIRRAGNQARPTVAFAAGNYLVAWMDARQYPVYGLYAARVSPAGEVLDADGRSLDSEDPRKSRSSRRRPRAGWGTGITGGIASRRASSPRWPATAKRAWPRTSARCIRTRPRATRCGSTRSGARCWASR